MSFRVLYYNFDLPTRFTPGHVCTEADAKTLNAALREILRQRVRRQIEKRQGDAGHESILDAKELDEIQAFINEEVDSWSWPTTPDGSLRVKTFDSYLDEILTELGITSPDARAAARESDRVRELAHRRLAAAQTSAQRILAELF